MHYAKCGQKVYSDFPSAIVCSVTGSVTVEHLL